MLLALLATATHAHDDRSFLWSLCAPSVAKGMVIIMEVSIAAQTIVFFKAVLLGAILSVVYDLFRVVRVLTKARRGKTAVFDAIFCIISMITLFFFIVFAAKGEARIYIAIGALLGASLYFMTLSKLALHVAYGSAKILSKLFYPLRKAIKKGAGAVRVNAHKATSKTKSFIKSKKYFNFYKK